nr:hypothetical protein [Tanacetum cinerariifolium]
QPKSELFLDEVELGLTGTFVVMVCRMWDVNAMTGCYLSTDFVLSDAKPYKEDVILLTKINEIKFQQIDGLTGGPAWLESEDKQDENEHRVET